MSTDWTVALDKPITSLDKAAAGAPADAGHDQGPRDGLSHVIGAPSPPLLKKTIGALLADTAATHPDATAAVFCDSGLRWTWRELKTEARRFAAGLLALGFGKGDRIGIWAPNRPEWLLTQFATAEIGLVMVNINPAYRLAELEYALNRVGCKGLILAESFKTSRYLEMLQSLAPELADAEPGRLQSEKLPHLRTVIRMGDEKSPGMVNFGDVAGMAGPAALKMVDDIGATLEPGDPINIQFTSGTTGAPKGATLTHRNIVNNARFTTDAMRFTAADRLCIPVPLYHCFGMVMGTLGCVTKGAAMIFPGEGFEPGDTLKALNDEKCTALYGVPTMFIAILSHPDFAKADLSALRTGIMAGAPCPIETMKQVIGDMNMTDVTIAYGMTETSPVSFQSAVDDPIEKRVSTVGRIQPHAECKIVDPDDGRTLPVGEQGELCTRGYLVMRGYWGDLERTREAVDAEGWMHTGDLATIDAEGYCEIVGRVKDMLIRGGENVYPREVEEFLLPHQNIQDVQVFGVPDERYGEEVCAWIVLKPGAEEAEETIRDFCRGQIAHYKIPRYIRFVDELPMTVTGKPQKFVMRDRMIEMLAAGARSA